MSEESFVYTACPGWGDHDYCTLKTIVKDGKILRTEKIIYSDPERPDGHICQKGCLAARQPYDENRLTKPLKRVGERGEGKWEEITWDQALDEIAAKLLDIKEKYGADSVCMWDLVAGVPPCQGFNMSMPMRFANAFGMTTMMDSIGLDNAPFYTEFYACGTTGTHNILLDPRKFGDVPTDLIYVWGCNPIENQIRCAQNLVRARENGAKIVDIGLIFDGTAGFADEFIGVKPASDGHLAMAMIDYILKNDLQNDAYLLQRTNAAFLVRDDNGQLYRDADGNFAVWNASTNAPGFVAPARGAYPEGEIALYGSYEVEGVSCKTALTRIKEEAAKWPASSAAAVVGLTAEEIEKIADDYARTERVWIVSGYGMRYANSNETYRMLNLLGVLTGRLGIPGNGVVESLQLQCWPVVFNDAPLLMPDPTDPTSIKSKSLRMAQWFDIAQKADSPYKALFIGQGNPIHQQPDRKRWLDVISNMELVVDYDVWMTDTGELSDYVLPDCMSFEREELIASATYNHLVLQEPAIEPPAGCKDPVSYYSELAQRVGLGHYFDKTAAEWIDIRLNSQFPLIAALEPKVTYERLKKEKMIRTAAPADIKYDPWLNPEEVMETPTGRIEIYAEKLADFGLAVTHPLEPNYIGRFEEYPFQLFTGRQRFFMQSSFTDDPITIKLSGETPATRLNPKDARELGLLDGDTVEVYNSRGHVITRLDIDECVPAGTVHVWFGWRKRQFEDGTYAEMVHQCPNYDSTGPVEDKWFADWVEHGRIPHAFLDPMGILVGSTDCYWDSVCNIRKYEAGKEA